MKLFNWCASHKTKAVARLYETKTIKSKPKDVCSMRHYSKMKFMSAEARQGIVYRHAYIHWYDLLMLIRQSDKENERILLLMLTHKNGTVVCFHHKKWWTLIFCVCKCCDINMLELFFHIKTQTPHMSHQKYMYSVRAFDSLLGEKFFSCKKVAKKHSHELKNVADPWQTLYWVYKLLWAATKSFDRSNKKFCLHTTQCLMTMRLKNCTISNDKDNSLDSLFTATWAPTIKSCCIFYMPAISRVFNVVHSQIIIKTKLPQFHRFFAKYPH